MGNLNAKQNRRILVVDDTRAIHDDFRKILCGENRGGHPLLDAASAALFGEMEQIPPPIAFEVDSAYQGQEGLKLVALALECGRPYAMTFVDVRMPPGWDGIETVENIWRVAPDTQVVICTAYSDYSWDQMIAKLGHSDRLLILKKPFDTVEVLQLAVALTEKWRLTHQARVTIADLEAMVQERSSELRAAIGQLEASLAERSRTEAALRTSEEKFSRAFRLHPDALSIHRLIDGACLEINPGFTQIMGYTTADTLTDEPMLRGWSFWVDSKMRERLDAALKGQNEITGIEGRVRRKDGSVIRCAISARVIEIGGESCVLAITRDLTVQKRLEEQLAQTHKMDAVGQLAGGIAHDYNNILTATLMQLELLMERTDLAPATLAALKELERMSNRSASLTRQLLAFSRQQVMQKTTINLNDALKNLFTMLRRLLGENIELVFQFAETPLLIDADVGMIDQLVINLCVNARDAMMPRGGHLTLKTGLVDIEEVPPSAPSEAYLGKFVFLSIADTGCGMDEVTLSHVFEPFFTTKEIGKGTGLGLATVYGIAQQHRGWVEVESEPGRGTVFRIMLPTVPGIAEVPLPSVPATIQRGTETILLVEDEDSVRLMVGTSLRRCGYQVHEACDGKQAVEQWGERAQKIDLLFSDIVMPNGISGLDLVEHFIRINPRLRIILSSGYSAGLNKLDSPNGSGIEYLPKPFNIVTLTDLVRKSLDSKNI